MSAFVNFDVDIIVMWQCLIPWSYTAGFILSFTLSFIKIGMSLSFYGLQRLCMRMVTSGTIKSAPSFLALSDEDVDATVDGIWMVRREEGPKAHTQHTHTPE